MGGQDIILESGCLCVTPVSRRSLPNHWTMQLILVWWCIIMTQSVMQKSLVSMVQDLGHTHSVESDPQKFCFFHISWIFEPFATKIGIYWCIIMSWSVVWHFWSAVLKVMVTVRVQIPRTYFSGWYLLNHLTFLHETWYVGASSWPRVSCKRSRSQCGLKSLKNNLIFFHISWTSKSFAITSRSVVWQFWIAVPKVQVTVGGSNPLGSICPDSIFWITEPFLIKLAMLVHHLDLDYHVKVWVLSSKVKVTQIFQI